MFTFPLRDKGEMFVDQRGTRIKEPRSRTDEESFNKVAVDRGQVDDRYEQNIHHSSDEDEDEDEFEQGGGDQLRLGIDAGSDGESSDDSDGEEEEESNRFIVDLQPGTKEEKRKRKADDWFSRVSKLIS
jgi:hypothetical protein